MTAAEHDLDALVEEVDRRRRNDRHQKWGLFVLAMLLMVVSAAAIFLAVEQANRADHSGAQVVVEQEEKKEIAKEAQQALCREGGKEIFDKDLCEKWATVAEEPPAPLPEDAAAEQAKLIAAFRAYCAEGNNCRGKDGQAPTPDDIATAFGKFCSTGACVGKDGKPGQKGADGKDAEPLAPEFQMVLAAVTEYCSGGVCVGPVGPVGPAGKDGTNATPEMVLAAVQQHCSEGACRGEKGDKGDTGEPGQNVTLVSWTDPRTGDKYTCAPNPPGSTTLTCSVEPGTPIPPVIPPAAIPGVGP